MDLFHHYGQIMSPAMIDLGLSYLMPFSTLFQLIRGGRCIHSCFPGVLLTSIRTILYPSH